MPRVRARRRHALRVLAVLVVIVAGTALVAACSGSKHTSAGGSSGTGVDVKNFTFSPGTLDVAVGAQVTWTFDDSANHTVHASDGSFQSAALSGGKTYSFTFTKPGTYDYVCSIHPFMKGSIVVK